MMSRLFSLTFAAVALASTWIVASAGSGNTSGAQLKQVGRDAGLTGKVYRLASMEGGGACLVSRGAKVSRSISALAMEPGCEALLPGMGRVKFWRERADGSVEFTGEGGDTLAAFSVGDGVDYESFRPRSPLLSLSSGG